MKANTKRKGENMKTSFNKYGRKDGKDLCEIVLENDHGMIVKVLNYGATLEKVEFFKKLSCFVNSAADTDNVQPAIANKVIQAINLFLFNIFIYLNLDLK